MTEPSTVNVNATSFIGNAAESQAFGLRVVEKERPRRRVRTKRLRKFLVGGGLLALMSSSFLLWTASPKVDSSCSVAPQAGGLMQILNNGWPGTKEEITKSLGEGCKFAHPLEGIESRVWKIGEEGYIGASYNREGKVVQKGAINPKEDIKLNKKLDGLPVLTGTMYGGLQLEGGMYSLTFTKTLEKVPGIVEEDPTINGGTLKGAKITFIAPDTAFIKNNKTITVFMKSEDGTWAPITPSQEFIKQFNKMGEEAPKGEEVK